MDDPCPRPCIRVRRKNVRVIDEHKDKIRELFAVRLNRKTSPPPGRQRPPTAHQPPQDVSRASFVYLSVEPDPPAPGVCPPEVASRLQMFVDSLCGSGGGSASEAAGAGDDSSYDSDYEDKEEAGAGTGTGAGALHADVSRTVSDTLGAEFAEYVSRGPATPTPTPAPAPAPAAALTTVTQQQGYAARVEFGLKLGYTEGLVQAALAKLGPSPGQNELLEELIRLGARATAAAAAAAATTTTGGGAGADASGGSSAAAAAAASAAAAAAAAAAGLLDDPEALALADALAALAAQEAEDAAAAAAAVAAAGSPALPAPAPAVQLRHIVIDGSNVAMSHGNKEVFSCRGIRICVDWFRARGHRDITVFVPKWRKEASRPDNPITEQEILTELERERRLVFTPSKLVGGKRIVCYDDRYVLRLAAETDGVVVSNDNYRDLAQESPEFRRVVEERILMYSFVNDRFMPPDDPLGRSGPTLEHFLRCPPSAAGAGGAGTAAAAGGAAGAASAAATGGGGGGAGVAAGAAAVGQPRRPGEPPPPPRCPYGKKCTYGNKCKFQHPERGPLPQKSVTERLAERLAEHHKQQMAARGQAAAAAGNPATKSVSLPLPGCGESPDKPAPRKTPLARTRSNAPGLAPPASTPAPAPALDLDLPAAVGVPKSRSVENIQGGGGGGPAGFAGPALQPPPPQGYGLWGRAEPAAAAAWCAPQRSLVFGDQGGHVAVAQRLSDPESAAPEAANLHRKLQRQLTLNPACDPRLQQLRAPHRAAAAAAAATAGDFGWEHAHAHARPAAPPPVHQHVTRNASAPDSYRPGPWSHPPAPAAPMGRNMFRHGSTSDPQINLCVEPAGDPFDAAPQQPPPPHGVWGAPPPQGPLVWGPPPPPPHPSTEEARRVLHYHLAALFPPEQVQQAMRMFPEETSAQKICAAILAMFPGKP